MKLFFILGVLALLLLAGCTSSEQAKCLEEIATKVCEDKLNGSFTNIGKYYDGWRFNCIISREYTDNLYFSYEEVEGCK